MHKNFRNIFFAEIRYFIQIKNEIPHFFNCRKNVKKVPLSV